MSRSLGERGHRKLARIWWSSLPLRVLLTAFVASCVMSVLAGILLVQQTSAGIVAMKRTASTRETVEMHRFIQGQLQSSERLGTTTYEQLSRLTELAEVQAAQYLMTIEGPASVLPSSSGIGLESMPVELHQQVAAGEGMYIAVVSVTIANEGEGKPGLVVGITLVTIVGGRFPVHYVSPMASEVAALRDTQHAVYAMGVVLPLGLAAIAYLVTLQMIKPVRKAGRMALCLASGQLGKRMSVKGTDDLASLVVLMDEVTSDLQQRIRRLETLSTIQRRLVSDVSYELRTPIITIKMASGLLYEECNELSPEAGRAMELMSAKINRSSCMLMDLLKISRFDAGVVILELDEVDMDALVTSEAQVRETFARSQGNELRLHLDGTTSVQLDARRIRRIVRNLLTNTIDHRERRPADVTITSDEEAVIVTVQDHGIRFGAELPGRVLDRFWRADPSWAYAVGGVGLGPAISLEDARLYRGQFPAWGWPGKETQFRSTLPRGPEVTLNSPSLPIAPIDLDSRKDLR